MPAVVWLVLSIRMIWEFETSKLNLDNYVKLHRELLNNWK